MDQRPVQPLRKWRIRRVEMLIGVLLIGVGLCYLLYEYSPIGWIYFMLRVDHFQHRVEALTIEYDELNDALLESLPIYPEASQLLQTQGRGWSGVPVGPRSLWVCFSTDNTTEQIAAFYQDKLEKNGWKSIREITGRQGELLHQLYTKDNACIGFHHTCWDEFERDGKRVYRVNVYHDLNVLLDFPDIPRIVYWQTIDSCP